jgi:hypothetical protein
MLHFIVEQKDIGDAVLVDPLQMLTAFKGNLNRGVLAAAMTVAMSAMTIAGPYFLESAAKEAADQQMPRP